MLRRNPDAIALALIVMLLAVAGIRNPLFSRPSLFRIAPRIQFPSRVEVPRFRRIVSPLQSGTSAALRGPKSAVLRLVRRPPCPPVLRVAVSKQPQH